MFIKLTLICLSIVPLIIGEESENPTPTRVGKFFGWLSVDAVPLGLFVSTNKRWQGELSLSFGRRPLIASEFHQYLDFRDRRRPYGNFPVANLPLPQLDAAVNDSDPSNATSTSPATSASGMHDGETTEDTTLESTAAETMQATSRTLKLEDYDEITLDDDVDGNRVRREATRDENVNNRGDNDDDMDSTTTVESSTAPVTAQEQEQSESSFVTMSPPPYSQQDSYANNHFPYPPSINPSAQHVSITYSPHHQPYLPPVKNYYDFYPSQLDYHRQGYMMPYCINSIHHKFTPIIHDAWSNYRKWK